MAITSNSYTGNGSTTLYSFTFPYLDTADVKVSLNGTVTTAYTFANATTIQFTTAPGAGVAIRIYRETDDTALEAVFSPGSSIRASDLNSDFDQLLYLGQESNNIAEDATTTANTALTTANTAISTANAATSTANTALSNSATAVSTANTASTNASNAVTTANTASSNASAAVTTANAATVTANSAASTAATALSTANTASSNASAAVSTANTASTNASNAVTTANTALSTANTASSNASTAVTTANNAVSTANGAASTASTALTTANAAISAVASAVIYTPVANLTALAALTPSNGDYFELTDSTGAEGSALITGVTVGLVGAPGLTFRLRYDAPPGIFTFLGYFANDSETRYLKFSGGTLTGQLRGDDSTSASTPGFAFDGDANTGIGRPGADELALITGGIARLTIDSAGAVAVPGTLSQGGNAVVVTTDSRLSDTRVPTDGSVTNTKVAAAAAIDGTKISPNFGSQNVVTTGTVSGASLSPTSSSVPTNGVYLPAANSVAVATNGTGRLFVDSSGRVLAGTSTSQGKFYNTTGIDHVIQVEGQYYCQSLVSNGGTVATGGAYLTLGRSRGTTSGSVTAVASGDKLGVISFQGTDGTDFVDAARIDVEVDGTPGANDMPGRIVLSTTADGASSPTERVRITSAGLVGIGTTSPNNSLDVVSDSGGIAVNIRNRSANDYGYLRFQNNAGSTTQASIGNLAGVLAFETGTTERARIDSSGRLLVGTSSARSNIYMGGASDTPKFQFEASGNDYSGQLSLIQYTSSGTAPTYTLGISKSNTPGTNAVVASGDTLGTINFVGNDGTNFRTAAQIQCGVDGTPGAHDMPGRLVFSVTRDGQASPTEAMRISNGGSVTLESPTGTNLIVKNNGGSGTALLYFQTSTNELGKITSNGSNAVTYATSSDYRLKENIVPLSGGIDRLKALKPSRFNFLNTPGEIVDGFIAHEAQQVVPQAVTGVKDEVDADGNPIYQGIDQSKLVPLLTAALQEAIGEIESLKARLTAAGI